jgi:beta-lactam-binding protein with PASTA domain
MLIMPKLVGLSVDRAIQELDTLELAYQVQAAASLDKKAGAVGTVVSQNPKPGFPVPFDTTVDIETNR